MKLSDVQTRVKRSFGDESGAQIDNDDIARWASDAQLDIVKQTKCNQTTSRIAVVSGQYDYTITSSITISSVVVDGHPLRAISQNELNQRFPDRHRVDISNGIPAFFTARDGAGGTVVTLYPTPNATTTEIVVTHNTRPSPVVNPTDEFSIPEEYHEIIFRRCLERAYEQDGQWTAAGVMAQDATGRINDAKADSADKTDDSYPSIRCLPGDLGGY